MVVALQHGSIGVCGQHSAIAAGVQVWDSSAVTPAAWPRFGRASTDSPMSRSHQSLSRTGRRLFGSDAAAVADNAHADKFRTMLLRLAADLGDGTSRGQKVLYHHHPLSPEMINEPCTFEGEVVPVLISPYRIDPRSAATRRRRS